MTQKTRRTFVAKEGRPYIFAMLVAGLLAAFFLMFSLAIACLAFSLLLVYLFRGTERTIPPSPLAVVSPIDGVVTLVQSCQDRYLERDAIRIVIKPNLFGEYVVRGPIEGKIKNHWIRERGRKAKTLAREYSYWIQTDEKDDAVLVLRPRLWLKPVWYVHVGERVGQGQRCGFLSFGGKVEVIIPSCSRVTVSAGQRVQSGSGILASLTHE